MLCWIVRFIVKLSLKFFFCLSSVRGRCFWASQILWWILTCSEQKFCFDCKPLLESYLDGIVVLDNLKCSVVLLDLLSCCHWTFSSVYQALKVDVFEHPRFCDEFSHLVTRCFFFDCKPLLESYLNGIDVLVYLKCSVELSDLLSSCHWTFSSVYQAWEVDVFEHPRFCDEFSHVVNRSFVSTASLSWSLTSME